MRPGLAGALVGNRFTASARAHRTPPRLHGPSSRLLRLLARFWAMTAPPMELLSVRTIGLACGGEAGDQCSIIWFEIEYINQLF